MARLDQIHPDNVDGQWFADTRCIACDIARHWAPDLIASDQAGLSYVAIQPSTPEDEAALWRAAVACPTKSIGNRQQRRPPPDVFPYELTTGVLALGHNSVDSFGAHSYLVLRPDGNLMVDSPRFTRELTGAIDEAGGIAHVLLSHRDDVADADRWADRYGARVWIHAGDAAAAPYATDVIDSSVTVAPGVDAIPIPGHTVGHLAFHIDRRWLFTGDALSWNHRREALDVFAGATWYSWDVLADSMDAIADLRVEWVFPGHGKWHHTGPDLYAEQMAAMGAAMREIGQSGWKARSR